MKAFRRLFCIALWLLLPTVPLCGATLPPGFREEPVGAGWYGVAGLTFGKNAEGTRDRVYVWERGGRVWIVENGVKLERPFVNLDGEVGAWGAQGMLGFALDPNFSTNGYVYLLYVVNRHHLLYYGTPTYNPEGSEDFVATIGRITRYTALRSDDFRTVDPASRRVLVGETKSTGLPILHSTHSTGSLVFGTDGSLLASVGDGASFEAVDNGGNAGNAYGSQGLAEGIITPAENVGAYRSQMLDSLSGKILRLDPATGNGIPSNPYYESGRPRSARSRIWSLGLRNPYRFALKPGTGAYDRAAGNPGTLFIGDVGWGMWEDLNVADAPGQNFGWPFYEGMEAQPDYIAARPGSIPLPSVHVRPKLDWTRTGTARTLVNGVVSTMGTGSVEGENFGGSCSTAGFFYTGTDFPAEYRGSYFHGDYAGQWLRVFDFDEQNQVTRVRPFASGEEFIFFTTHPETGGLYYCTTSDGATVWRVTYDPGTNRPPTAAISYDRQAGTSPLTVQFSSILSSDPDGTPLTYAWNFGDGTTSNLAAPVKTFTTSTPRRYDVTLTVRDAGGAAASTTQIITAGNTAPRVNITSPPEGARYALTPGNQTLPLTATVTDAEHSTGSLTYSWQVGLAHDHHEHLDPVINAANASTIISPVACVPDATYYYRIRLTVTDPLGAVSVAERRYGPDCGTEQIVTFDDSAGVAGPGQAVVIDVLDNDHGAVTSVVPAQMQTVRAPTAGTVSWDRQTGRALYRHIAGAALADNFTYRATTRDGLTSAPATVWLTVAPAGSGAPAAVGEAVPLVTGETSRLIRLLDNDLHAAGAAGSILLHERPLLGAVALNLADGTATYTPFSGLTYPAKDSFTYSIGNAAGRSLPARVEVSMSGPVTPEVPVLTNPGGQTSVRGSVVSLPVNGTQPNGLPMIWSATGLPAGLSINAGNGLISGTVSTTAAATNTVTVTATVAPAVAASVTFSWTTTAGAGSGGGSGLHAEFWSNATHNGTPVLTRTDVNIAYEWQGGSPGAGLPVDEFSARWSGELTAPYTETYTFYVGADDGVRLWLDGTLVLDRWQRGAGGTSTVNVPLAAGQRTPFRLDYYEGGGWATMFLVWSSARQPWQVVPASAFSNGGGAVGDTTLPTVLLTGPTTPAQGTAGIGVQLSEVVTGLDHSDFTVTGGRATALTPDPNQPGTYVLTIEPADIHLGGSVSTSLPAGRCQDAAGNGNTPSDVLTTAFNRVPIAPEMTNPGTRTSIRGTAVSLQLLARDRNNDPLTYFARGLPAGLGLNVNSGIISGTVSATAANSYNVTAGARETSGQNATSVAFKWNIETTDTPINGLLAEYFANATLSGAPLLVRTDANLSNEWQGNSPAPGLPVDDFSIRWTGEILPRYSETYTFYAGADDGVRLWIDNTLVLDRWGRAAGGSHLVDVPLVANRRTPFRVEYFEGGGWATMFLVWFSASQSWEAVPAARLFPPAAPNAQRAAPNAQRTALTAAIGFTVASAAETVTAAASTARLVPAGADCDFVFLRPWQLSVTHLCIIEASGDLLHWHDVTSHALVKSDAFTATDEVRLSGLMAHAGRYTGQGGITSPPPTRAWYRLRIVPAP